MKPPDPGSLIEQFNDYINTRDLDGRAALMTERHTFIDMAGNSVKGKERCVEVWRDFFDQFPDYRNHFERIEASDEFVAVAGHSSCSDERLAGAALWSAKVDGLDVAEWRVYEDTPENRALLGLE